MGLRVIVSDDVPTTGSGSSTEYSTFAFTAGSVASGEQAGLTTETDRDILAKSDAMSIDLHYTYHPVGSKWAVTTTNPTRSQLETVGNWSKVYETKNIGIVRITQATNKTTGVTLNTESGQITMNNAALAAAAEASFTVTNDKIAATDVVVVNHGSGGTAGSYLVGATAIAAGSFEITVTNVSSGSLSEAIVINFVALKGASS
jgi:hypothetical protein